MHSRGHIHRDIHPSRLHLADDGLFKFNPVGWPFNFKKLLKRDNFTGHLNYSAPELILENEHFDEKVDVWACGCTLYYLLTKREPFEAQQPQEVKENILQLRLERVPSNIPASFLRLIRLCLNLDPVYRPSIDQLLLELEQIDAASLSQQ